MLLERKGLLATLQSFPQLLQDNDKLQHTALVTLEEHQRALVLMRYKDFFHPRETLPAATAKPSENDRVATSVTPAPDARIDNQQEPNVKVGLQIKHNVNSVHKESFSAQNMQNGADVSNQDLPERTSIIDLLNGRFSPDVDHNDHISPQEISLKTIAVQNHMWNQTKTVSENIESTVSIENSLDIYKFQKILSALPDAVLFNALCRKCAASVRQTPTHHGRKLLRLILQKNRDIHIADEIHSQEFDDKVDFRTRSDLFNTIGRPETIISDGSRDNYIANAIDYPPHLSDIVSVKNTASGVSQFIFQLGVGDDVAVEQAISAHTSYQSIVDQFRKAEASRQWELVGAHHAGMDDGDAIQYHHGNRHHQGAGRRRGKRMVMKTQVCPVVQSWSNLVLAKTANGTLVQIAQVCNLILCRPC